jgi:hypothetical protein
MAALCGFVYCREQEVDRASQHIDGRLTDVLVAH